MSALDDLRWRGWDVDPLRFDHGDGVYVGDACRGSTRVIVWSDDQTAAERMLVAATDAAYYEGEVVREAPPEFVDVLAQARAILRIRDVDRAIEALAVVVEAFDRGQIVDAGKLAALAGDGDAGLEFSPHEDGLSWRVWSHGDPHPCCKTPQSAIEAAEGDDDIGI